ncbi:MAG TPA: hypothetical protein VGC29_04470 [Flavisolibacter sp.]
MEKKNEINERPQSYPRPTESDNQLQHQAEFINEEEVNRGTEEQKNRGTEEQKNGRTEEQMNPE